MYLENKNTIFPLSILSIIGIAILLFSTKSGIGISPDSVQYIAAARNLLSGKGLSIPSGDELIPLTHYPPLFPALLAVLGFFDGDPLNIGRWLNAFLFGANIILVGFAIGKYAKNSVWFPVIGSFLILTSVDMLGIHSMAWSEPLFIFFSILGLLLLDSYLKNQKPLFLITASISFALGFLTRYIGITVIAAGAIGIFLLSNKIFYKRVLDSVICIVISCFPMILWIIRNSYAADTTTNRKIIFHAITLDHVKSAFSTVSLWLLPEAVPPVIRVIILMLLIALLFGYGLFLSKDSAEYGPLKNLYLLALFTSIYIGFLIISISFFDAHTPMDYRIMSPVYVSGLILSINMAQRMLMYTKRRGALILIGITFLSVYLIR